MYRSQGVGTLKTKGCVLDVSIRGLLSGVGYPRFWIIRCSNNISLFPSSLPWFLRKLLSKRKINKTERFISKYNVPFPVNNFVLVIFFPSSFFNAKIGTGKPDIKNSVGNICIYIFQNDLKNVFEKLCCM